MITHLEPARGTDAQNEKYCTKEDTEPLVRVGSPSKGTTGSGGGSQLQAILPRLVEYVKRGYTFTEILDRDPDGAAAYIRHGRRLEECIRAEVFENSRVELASSYVGVRWKGWQEFILNYILEPPHEREVLWIVDPEGGKGKTFLTKYIVTQYGAFRAESLHTMVNQSFYLTLIAVARTI